MKLLLLLELAGLLAFGSLIFPSIKYVAEGNPLPEIEKPKETISIIEAASIDFEGMNVKLYYNSLSGFSYSDPNSQWERQKTPVCNADKTKCLYADFYQQFELKQNDEILEPDQIINFQNDQISVYFLDTSTEIYQKYSYAKEDVSISCYNPQLCKDAQSVTVESIRALSTKWKEMSESDRKRYGRYFDTIMVITNHWNLLDPTTGGIVSSDEGITLRYHQNEQGKIYIQLQYPSQYFELTEVQFNELKDLVGK